MLKNKQKVSYTVDKILLKDFNKRAKELSINKSALIENLIKKWMNDNESR